ncbi:TlpA family protein disulfide reductase [Paenibacillus assamensis]|uniref:TlpA family protein disulfide reductase n=1 Tax=Paenibacillus assamensis TaxID=311244 RepID=UPI00042814F6|nr:TlpA disulfide reductase family protein [Paenibacillus assamensis]
MKMIRKVVVLCLLAIIPIVGIYVINNPMMIMEAFADLGGFQKGDAFPVVKGEDVHNKEFSLEDYKGKPFIIMMAKIDCEICKQSYPYLADWEKNNSDIPFVMVGQGGREQYKAVWQEQQFQFPILDADNQIQESLKMKIFPVFYAVDANGEIKKRMNGYDEGDLKAMVNEVRQLAYN